jgi:hypothetical protein
MKRLLEMFGYERRCAPIGRIEGKHAAKYLHFRDLLNRNHEALGAMAGLEEMVHSGRPFTGEGARGLCEELVQTVRALVFSLGQITGRECLTLTALCASFERELQEEFRSRPQRMDGP